MHSRRAFLQLSIGGLPAILVLAACGAASPTASPSTTATSGGSSGASSQTGAPGSAPAASNQTSGGQSAGGQAAASSSTQAASQRAAAGTAPAGQASTSGAQVSASAGPASATGQAGGQLQPTPSCGGTATVAQTEGPYFKPSSPLRTSLVEAGMAGTKLTLSGYVLTPDCKPVQRALLDFWQADNAGQYDNTGFRLRGHQFTDDAGKFTMETVMPGLYTGRTRHIHVKVQAPNGPALTTQLYFPGEAANNRDGIFDKSLVLTIQDGSAGKLGTFNFVVKPTA